MKRTLFAAVAAAGLMAFGCDDTNNNADGTTPTGTNTNTTPMTESTAEKASENAVDKLQKVEKAAENAVDKAQDNRDNDSPVAVAAEKLRGNIADLTGKAKLAVQERKFDDAQKFVQQIKDLKGQLPAEFQTQVDASLAGIDQEIAAGKAAMKPAGQ